MRANMYDVSLLLAVDYEAAAIFVKKSAINRKNAAKHLFVRLPMRAEEVIGYYYGSLVCSDR